MILPLRQDQFEVLERSDGNVVKVQAERIEGVNQQDLSLMLAGGGTFAIMLLVGGKIIGTAMLLSVASIGGASVLYIKVPGRMDELGPIAGVIKRLPITKAQKESALNWDWKKAIEKHEVAADIAISVGAVFVFGTSLTGLLSATITGLGMSLMFRIIRMYKRMKNKARYERDLRWV